MTAIGKGYRPMEELNHDGFVEFLLHESPTITAVGWRVVGITTPASITYVALRGDERILCKPKGWKERYASWRVSGEAER